MGEVNKEYFPLTLSNICNLFNLVNLIQIIIAIEADADCSEIEIWTSLFKVFHKTHDKY